MRRLEFTLGLPHGGVSSLACRLACPVLSIAAGLTSGRASPVLIRVPTLDPWTVLTFDDGPHPATTPALLEVLARHRAKATFFLIGERAVAYPTLVADIVAAGHELGNHLWSDRPSVLLPLPTLRAELARTGQELARHASVPWWRPGHGMFTPTMVGEAELQGYRGALGSPWLVATRYTGDHQRRGERLACRAHPGAIAILHEGTYERSVVSQLADGYLRRLTQLGLGATTLGHLAGG